MRSKTINSKIIIIILIIYEGEYKNGGSGKEMIKRNYARKKMCCDRCSRKIRITKGAILPFKWFNDTYPIFVCNKCIGKMEVVKMNNDENQEVGP